MDAYAAVLLWAIPGFLVLVLAEILYGYFTKNQSYTFMDTLASLSSGMTNILKGSNLKDRAEFMQMATNMTLELEDGFMVDLTAEDAPKNE